MGGASATGGASGSAGSGGTGGSGAGGVSGNSGSGGASAIGGAGGGAGSAGQVPNPPVGVSATADIRHALVTWSAPSNTGSSAITGYVVTSVPAGGTAMVSAGTHAADVNNLANGTSYVFNVVATNAAGSSAAGVSNQVSTYDVPGAPTNLAVTTGFGIATLTWDGPASSGGQSITGFAAVATDGVDDLSYSGTATTATFDGLDDGGNYTFKVHATNAVGDGPDAVLHQTMPCETLALPSWPLNVKTSGANGNQAWARVFAGDIDGDGHADVLGVANNWTDIDFFHGQNNGTFARAKVIQVPNRGDFAFAGDVNKDGKLDVIQASGSTITVYLGDGAGGFSAASGTIAPLPGNGIYGGAIADLNGDSKPDLVIVSGAYYTVLLGQGNGNFPQRADIPLGYGWIDGVAAGDLDGDLVPDLVMGVSGDLLTLKGNGDGSFASAVPYPSGEFNGLYGARNAGSGATDIQLADLNGDHKLDVVVMGDEGPPTGMQVFLNSGDGTLGPPASYATGDFGHSLVLADFNEDGKLDAIIGSYGVGPANNSGALPYPEANIEVFMGDGAGHFGAATPVASGPVRSHGLAAADFDGDGHLDLVVTPMTSGFFIYKGRGDGTFVSPGLTSVPMPRAVDASIEHLTSTSGPSVMVLGFDTSTFPYSNIIQTFPVLANGTLGTPVAANFGPNSGEWNRYVSGDFNNDGKLDLAISYNDAKSFGVTLGDGTGHFGTPQVYTASSNVVAIDACDVDSDGKVDVVVDTSGISIFPGKGNGTLGLSFTVLQNAVASSNVGCRDVNGDGHPDLLFVGSDGTGAQGLFISLGDGAFGFAPPTHYAGNSVRIAPVYGDVNGDGHLDVVADVEGEMGIYLGDGKGGFSNEIYSTSFPGPYTSGLPETPDAREIALADMDQDGHPDVVVATVQGFVTVFFGAGDVTFPRALAYPVATNANMLAVATGDLNGDGRPDVVALPDSWSDSAPTLNVMLQQAPNACY